MKSPLLTILAAASVLALAGGTGIGHAAWQHPHGDAGNTGFAKVNTLPAASPLQVPGVGPMAPGANPVIGPDGTVYVGNLRGELLAFLPDGTPVWSRRLNPNHGMITASPVVGADGSIYVVSTFSAVVRRDGQSEQHRESWLHKFTPGGGWLFALPFPEKNYAGIASRGVTSAFPNIWRWNGTEAILVPVIYGPAGGENIHVIAFSSGGAVLADQRVTHRSFDTTGSSPITDTLGDFLADLGECLTSLDAAQCGGGFSSIFNADLAEVPWPMPGVGIWEYPQGSPWIWMADGFKDTVAYQFDTATGFSEIYRFSDPQERRSSPPVAMDNVIAAVGTEDGRLKFERGDLVVPGFGPITGAPTRLSDGRLALMQRGGRLSVLRGAALEFDATLTGDSMVSAAASCTHVFAATTAELVTFDAKTLAPVARLAWTGGGISAPVIGPQGQVYAIAARHLYVFPGPVLSRFQSVRPTTTACDRPVLDRYRSRLVY